MNDQPGSIEELYVALPRLFSLYECAFLDVLDQFIGPDYRVLGKVRVSDVAVLKSGLDKAARQAELDRISGERFDFVVCRSKTLSVACAIKLADNSIATEDARQRGEYVAALCRFIGLPLLQFPPRSTYKIEVIREQVLAAIAAARKGPGDLDPAEWVPAM